MFPFTKPDSLGDIIMLCAIFTAWFPMLLISLQYHALSISVTFENLSQQIPAWRRSYQYPFHLICLFCLAVRLIMWLFDHRSRSTLAQLRLLFDIRPRSVQNTCLGFMAVKKALSAYLDIFLWLTKAIYHDQFEEGFSWTLYDSAIFLRKIWRAFIALLSCLHFILQHCGRWCWLSRSHSDEHDSFDPGMPGSYPSSAHRPQYEMQGSIQLDSPAVSPLQVGGEVNNMEKVTSLVELQNVSECSQKTEHATSTPTEDSPRTLALAVDGVQSIEATNDDNTSSEEAQSPEDTELSAHVTSNYSTHFEPSSSDDSDDETGPSGERPRSAWSMTDIFQEFGGRHHSRSTEEGDTLNDQRDTHQETPINGTEDAQGQVDCPLFREIVYGSPRQTSQYVGRPFQSPPVSPRTRTSEGLVARRIRALHMNIERPAIDRDVGRARQERVQLNLVQERIQHFEEQSRDYTDRIQATNMLAMTALPIHTMTINNLHFLKALQTLHLPLEGTQIPVLIMMMRPSCRAQLDKQAGEMP